MGSDRITRPATVAGHAGQSLCVPRAEYDYEEVHRPDGFASLTDEKRRRYSQPSLPEKGREPPNMGG